MQFPLIVERIISRNSLTSFTLVDFSAGKSLLIICTPVYTLPQRKRPSCARIFLGQGLFTLPLYPSVRVLPTDRLGNTVLVLNFGCSWKISNLDQPNTHFTHLRKSRISSAPETMDGRLLCQAANRSRVKFYADPRMYINTAWQHSLQQQWVHKIFLAHEWHNMIAYW